MAEQKIKAKVTKTDQLIATLCLTGESEKPNGDSIEMPLEYLPMDVAVGDEFEVSFIPI